MRNLIPLIKNFQRYITSHQVRVKLFNYAFKASHHMAYLSFQTYFPIFPTQSCPPATLDNMPFPKYTLSFPNTPPLLTIPLPWATVFVFFVPEEALYALAESVGIFHSYHSPIVVTTPT